MNAFHSLSFTLWLIFLVGCHPDVPPPAPVLPLPSRAQLEWHRMERNVFIHFGINTFTNNEWGFGDESPELFDPTNFDAEQWVSVFAEVGFKGLILTVKHHDGFCLWPSPETEHSVRNSPWMDGRGDIVREVADACRRHDLAFGLYLSPWDRNHPEYGTQKYISYYRAQLGQLFQEYGPVFEMWFDGANGGDGFYGGANERRQIDGRTYYNWPETIRLVRNMAPEVLFFSDAGPDIRWCGNERGVGGETNWNMITPDTLYPGKPKIYDLLNEGSDDGAAWIPAEVNTSIRPGWFYHPEEDSLVKTPEQLFDLYLMSVGRGSTLLLNIPPDPRGRIHENDIASIRGWKRLLDDSFAHDLAFHKDVKTTSFWKQSPDFDGRKVTDGDPETYWAADEGDTAISLTLDLGQKEVLRFIVLREPISLGQRIRSFTVEAEVEDGWRMVTSGTTIGYKRILRIPSITSRRIRITIHTWRAVPLLSAVSVF